jgi:hypothetical protein
MIIHRDFSLRVAAPVGGRGESQRSFIILLSSHGFSAGDTTSWIRKFPRNLTSFKHLAKLQDSVQETEPNLKHGL